ncbi:structural maintenance of chromosomes protein 6 [Nematocida major]|uniref:structural maintenance of chromosomes protein 6 n=1 Tax=Nematocida major TaxID=1912982 RepID=UPI0020072770|nr:structural maintenance of chromosomes protein 6 [Nematocida major]KAH9385718.1 structural maintenance of chromosomes protein 6 [Nematocida major]
MSSPFFMQSIQLVNFMCHDNLLVEFSKKVTCIVGSNGSGKSAVMVALGVLFGVRASLMRGSSHKQYIKTGEEYAVIRVHIKTQSPEAAGTYKDTHIEKRISPESSRIKITVDGEVVGRTQEDLNAFIEQERINLKSPISFLTQDEAKKILKSHSAKGMYSFFKAATEIESIEDIHAQSQSTLEEIKTSLHAAHTRYTGKKKTLESLRSALNAQKSLQAMGEQVRALRIEHEWSKVGEIEKKRSEAERAREALLNSYADMSREHQNLLDQAESISKQVLEAARKRADARALRHAKNEKASEAIAKNEKRKKEIQREIEYYAYEIEQKTKKLARIQQILGAPKKEPEEDINELKEQHKARAIARKSLEVQQAQLDITIKKVQAEEEKARPQKDANMEAAVQEISQRKLDVLGPLHAHIKVKDEKWVRAIEALLGSALFGFIVHTAEDRAVLESVLEKHRVRRYRIYLTKPQKDRVLDRIYEKARSVSNKILATANVPGLTTVISQVEGSPLLVETLVVLLGIERVGLLESRSKAYEVVQRRCGLECILTPSADRIQCVGSSLSDMRCAAGRRVLSGGSTLPERGEQLAKEARETRKMLVEAREKERALEKKIEEIEERMRRKENDEMEEEKKSVHEEIQKMQEQQASVQETWAELLRNEAHLPRVEPAEEGAEDAGHRRKAEEGRDAVRRDIVRSEDGMRRSKAEIEKIEAELEEMHRACTAAKARAEESGHVLRVDRTPQEVKSDLEKAEARMRAAEEVHGEKTMHSEEETARSEREVQSEVCAIEQVLQEGEQRKTEIERATKERIKKREEMLKAIASAGREEFASLMRMREYEGVLDFDHLQEELHISVKVSEASRGNKGSLSGGERSFSGACFLLALWPLISSPLRVLDEFDVFMDGLNRKAAFNLVFEVVRKLDTQVIIISPLGMASTPPDICEVVTLKAPVR